MYLNLGPRAGMAYQVDEAGRLVVRGRYGIFYTRYPAQYLLQTIAINPPFAGTFANSQQITNGTPLLTLDRPYPATGARTSFSPAGFDRDFVLPWNHQWNVTIERELSQGTTFSASYIGNRGSHLFRSVNANGPRLDPSTGLITREYRETFGTSSILVRRTDGQSIYHSMVTEVRSRAGKNLQFQGNWTWGVVDATLAKSVRLQHLFNTPNYDLPDRNLSNTNTVGTISGLTRAPRQVQFAARLDF